MSTAKEEARKILDSLPDGASWRISSIPFTCANRSNAAGLKRTRESSSTRKRLSNAWRVGSENNLTDSAWQELECAASFIARDSRRYAAAFVEEARDAARSLRKFPRRGRLVPETADDAIRELFVRSYRLIHEIRSDRVLILAFIHGARRFPSELI